MTRIALAASLALSAALITSSALPVGAATEKALYSFKSAKYGLPLGRLLFHNGSLFGTGSGDNYGNGSVFRLTNPGGAWKETSPLKFDNTDGAFPRAGLTVDSLGTFYGTTFEGDAYGGGNVFSLWKSGTVWLHGTVWAFGNFGDGAEPESDLVMDGSGNLYGTASNGGANCCGIVFELSFNGSYWTEAILHNFAGGTDGSAPLAGLLLDKSGNLFGTTFTGGGGCGSQGCGTVFELAPNGGGWTYSVLYRFTGGSDSASPSGVLIEGSKGGLYGTTTNQFGEGSDAGTVFELTESGGIWNLNTLYTFTGGSDGGSPQAGLRWNGSGGLYGTTYAGGAHGLGSVFELTPSGGSWTESVLYSFCSLAGCADGTNPDGAVILDKSGNLYGTTEGGGVYGNGDVWEVTP